jgi:hypothetical protein
MSKYIKNAFLLILIFAAGFGVKSVLETNDIVAFLHMHGQTIAIWTIITLIVVAVLILVIYQIAKIWLTRKFGINLSSDDQDMITGLVDQFSNPEGITEPTSEERQRGAIISLSLWMARRGAVQFYAWLVVTIMGGIVGTATVFLLYEQNKKLDSQNQQIILQTQANIAASILLEGSRRASLSQGMQDLFKDIRDEVSQITKDCSPSLLSVQYDCRAVLMPDSGEIPQNTKQIETRYTYRLSEKLTQRVVSQAEESAPYHLLISKGYRLDMARPITEQFIFPELSPERGLLLITLIRNDVDLWGINFGHANLANRKLRDAYLVGADLNGSDFTNSNLNSAKLMGADLSHTSFAGTQLINADLSRTILSGTDFSNSVMFHTNLSGARFRDVIILDADISQAWAWRDDPPFVGPNVPALNILTCDFDSLKDTRSRKPKQCEGE